MFKVDNTNIDSIYNVFEDSYKKSTGQSWSKDKLLRRARNWSFFGDLNGFVAVRIQRSGLHKLVATAGNVRGILKGWKELSSKDVPIWGAVSKDILPMIQKDKDFKKVNQILLRGLLPFIPKEVFGGVDYKIKMDGGIQFKYDDVGVVTKYMIGNKRYYNYLLTNTPIPETVKKLIRSMTGVSILDEVYDHILSKKQSQCIEESKVSINNDGQFMTVYHRSRKGIDKGDIFENGIRPELNTVAHYGKGLYNTYVWNDLLRHGTNVLQGFVDVSNFCIQDPDVYNQLKYHDDGSKTHEEHMKKFGYTGSGIPEPNWLHNNYPKIQSKGYHGIVYTNGQRDGSVVAIWEAGASRYQANRWFANQSAKSGVEVAREIAKDSHRFRRGKETWRVLLGSQVKMKKELKLWARDIYKKIVADKDPQIGILFTNDEENLKKQGWSFIYKEDDLIPSKIQIELEDLLEDDGFIGRVRAGKIKEGVGVEIYYTG